MRRFLITASVLATMLVCVGCSSSRGASYSYGRHQAGNIAASDSVGAALFRQPQVQTAFVPTE